MTPEQLQSAISKGQPLAAAYLFLGQEGYQRKLCKDALLERVLPGDAKTEGLTQLDLEEITLREIIDDARSLSLFTTDRIIWVKSAEEALPRRLASSAESEENTDSPGDLLTAYLKAATPGTVVVFECSRYDFAGDDRAKLERVQRFYSAVPATVEFRHYTPETSRYLAQDLAKKAGIKLAGAELAMLLEAVAGDASRLAVEIEKLRLFTGTERKVTAEDLSTIVPHAAQATIFGLVNALGRRDRVEAFRALEILMREGEYLPLALTFLSTQFRLALAAKEAKLSSAQQAQAFFSKMGVRMWRERAEQTVATAAAFTRDHLAHALAMIYETDKKFRDGYRDDRIVMELLIVALT
jgi:DNA polymerase-3 subunit delta